MLNSIGIAWAFSAATTISGVFAPDMDTEKSMPGGDPTEIRAEMPEQALPGRWLTSFEEAKQLATTHQLPLILHFEAPWCGACRQMDTSVMNQPEVTTELARSVIGVRIDADKSPELINQYGISSLPTEVIINPDGSEQGRYVGGSSLSTYVARLKALPGKAGEAAGAETEGSGESQEDKLRECLIVKHDGKMVGLGGFSPVALLSEKEWKRGSETFMADHEGVTYFFQTAEERDLFQKTPAKFIPELHGCDLVELSLDRRAEVGAIEYGAFYKGRMFFFASLENREKFQRNPAWYADGISTQSIKNPEQFPFLKMTAVE